MALSLDDFLTRLNESGLLSSAEVRDLLDKGAGGQPAFDVQAFAQELVRQKKLTKFQAEQIYAGKGKSLTLGNYLILDKLGQGGMGMVLKAKHTRMGRLVALKVMSPAALKSPDAVKRFHREVQAAAKLEHPNIVTAYDADEAHGTHFLVMQFIEGNDLSEFVKKHGPLPAAQAVRCILQAARGLEFAHEQGVIHRDIKPANLLIDKKGTVKILDMGLARIDAAIGGSSEGAGLTNTGAIMGTVDYMPPEQALDAKHADARSDIYSLGISLYYLLTGKVAYGGDTMMKKLMAHRETPIPSLVEEQRRLGLRPDPDGSAAGRDGVPTYELLDAVFRRMVAKRPEDRLQTMTLVIAELERCLPGLPTMASGASANSSASGVSAGSGNELQQFLRQISGEESTTTTKTNPSVSKATAVSPSSRDAETTTSATAESGADSESEATVVLEQSRPGRSKKKAVSKSSAKSRKTMLVSVSAAALVVLLVIVFALRGKSGTLHLAINDDLIEVTIGETGRVVKGVTEQDLSLPVGEHVLHVKRDDLAFDTEAFEVTQGENVAIRVERVGRRVRAMQGSTLLGHKESPKSKDKVTDRPASPDFALEFVLGSTLQTVEVPLASLDPNEPWTLEGYIQPADIPDHNHGLPAIFGADVWQIGLNHWSMRFVEHSAPAGTDRSENVLAESSVESLRGKRFHVAAVYADKLAQLFINGRLVGGAPSKFLPKQNLGKLILGARFRGTMNEWRISKVGRYGKDFTPPQRYETDADTLALYHFDEGSGDVLKDSSGKNNHGKIVGAKWVRAESGLVDSDDPDRRAATYILSAGGKVLINEDVQFITDVRELPKLRFRLTSIHVPVVNEVSAGGLAACRDCEHLTQLSLGDVAVGDAGLEPFRQCKKLKELDLSGTNVTDAGLAIFSGCGDLTNLGLYELKVTDLGLAAFKDCKKLESLSLLHARVTEKGLDHFRDCQNLQLFNTSNTLLGDAALIQLKQFPKLTQVVFSNAQVTNAGLASLPSLQNLTLVNLTGTQVDDAGVEQLKRLSHLTDLILSGTKVTSVGITELKKALPKCKIETDITKTVKSIDLLPLVDVQRDAGVGNWKRITDGVACENPAGANVLQLPYEPPEEYDFEIEFTTTGNGLNVNQYVAASGQMFAWKLNAHNVTPPLYGFELLDGKFAKENKEAATQIPDPINDGQRYRSTIEVRRGSLRTLLDGKELVKWTGDFKRLSMETATPMKHPGRIGIGSWRRPVTFHSVTVREVSGPGKLLAVETGWLDVLPLVDPQRDKLEYPNLTGKNDRQMRDGELLYTGDAKSGKLAFPVKIAGPNVEVEFDATRTSGTGHINVDLPSSKGPIPIELSRAGSIVQLGWPPVVVGKLSTKLGQRITYLVKIAKVDQQDVIDVFADGVSIGHWQGQRDAIGKPDPVKYPQATSSGFWTYSNTSWTIHRVRLRAPGGSVEPIKTAAVETGWRDLFNGKDLAGWKAMGFNGWTVENGALLGKTTATAGNGWLMSDREFTDYELELEYKLGPGSNSGIFLRAFPEGAVNGQQFREIQLLDDESPSFASQPAKNRTGSLFGLVAPDVAPKVATNQWHRVRVHLEGQQLQLTINDVAVLKHSLTDLRPSGRIGLQLYPSQIEFRNIRVRPLGPNP